MAHKKREGIAYTIVDRYPGYRRKQDQSNMEPGVLVYPSKNVFINNKEKIVSRKGYTVFGQDRTEDIAIRSSYDEFKNVKGYNMVIRETPIGGAEGDRIEVLYNGVWNRITKNPNPLPRGKHIYSFGEYWDKQDIIAKLVWVNGNSGAGAITEWNGAVSTITNVTATTLSIDPSETWFGNGFETTINELIINGTAYTFTGGHNTNTLTGVSPSPVGIVNPGDVAFDTPRAKDPIFSDVLITGFNFDICSVLYNQFYYADYNRRDIYVSNIGRDYFLTSKQFIGNGVNDGSFGVSSPAGYTGQTKRDYKIVIDGVTPQTEDIEFSGNGNNDIQVDFSGFSGIAGDTYDYVLTVVSDAYLTTFPVIFPWQIGEVIIGSTSGASAVVLETGSTSGSIQSLSGQFLLGENIVGQTTGISVVNTGGVDYSLNGYTWSRNGVLITVGTVDTMLPNTIDGIVWKWNQSYGHSVGDTWKIRFRQSIPDTYAIYIDGVLTISGVPLTNTLVLPGGIQFTVDKTTGHTIGDSWSITAYNSVTEGYRDMTYTEPLRLPGEGARLYLDSPTIAMRPQESQMYFFTDNTSIFITKFSLSGDLTNESLTVEKLKSEKQNQPLSNDLIGYIKNSIVYVSRDSTLDKLGRIKSITTPQSRPMSDQVKIDFLKSDFTNGHITFHRNKTWISLPMEGKLFCYDHEIAAWQPPQHIPVARFSIIDGELYGHSSFANETYKLFDGWSDNGQPINAVAVMSYMNYSERANKKSSNEFYIEGYIQPNTDIEFGVRYEMQGCGKSLTDIIKGSDTGIVCIGGDDRSLGKQNLGRFSLAALNPLDIEDGNLYKFRVIKQSPRYDFYEVQYSFSTYGVDLAWQLLAFGTAEHVTGNRNVEIKQ